MDQILYELLNNSVVQEATNRKDELLPGIFVDFSPDKFLSSARSVRSPVKST